VAGIDPNVAARILWCTTHPIPARSGTGVEATQDEPIAIAASSGETNAIDAAKPR
jgi:hypothetical protein